MDTYVNFDHMDNTPMQNTAITNAYAQWVARFIDEGWEAWIITFMMKNLRGGRRARKDTMAHEVEAFHNKLSTRITRNPKGFFGRTKVPQLFACPDLPVYKHEKAGGRLFLLNGGDHFNGILLCPYTMRSSSCRIKVPIDQHMEDKRLTYCGPGSLIDRIDMTLVDRTPEKAARYVLKAYENARIGSDDLLLLPRASEDSPVYTLFMSGKLK